MNPARSLLAMSCLQASGRWMVSRESSTLMVRNLKSLKMAKVTGEGKTLFNLYLGIATPDSLQTYVKLFCVPISIVLVIGCFVLTLDVRCRMEPPYGVEPWDLSHFFQILSGPLWLDYSSPVSALPCQVCGHITLPMSSFT